MSQLNKGPEQFSHSSASDQVDYASVTEKARGSDSRSAGRFGGRRQLNVARLVTTHYVVPCHSEFGSQGCRSSVVGLSNNGTSLPLHSRLRHVIKFKDVEARLSQPC